MQSITVKCPAKINLTLEVLNKREDGFHNIKSVMQTISLYDYLDIHYDYALNTEINLTGNNNDIPYDSTNLVYKAATLFLKEIGNHAKIDIYINKNIPVAAGLAGGSTDAAGTLYGLNEIFDSPLDRKRLHNLCSQLGSDLNVCLEGGCILATSRGEKIQKLNTLDLPVSLIKPKNLGISAKEAYTKYSLKEFKPFYNMSDKMISAINKNEDIEPFLYNDLEYAIFDDYKEFQEIKTKLPNSIMSGSGSTYFVLGNIKNNLFGDDYQVITELNFSNKGVEVSNCNNFVTN